VNQYAEQAAFAHGMPHETIKPQPESPSPDSVHRWITENHQAVERLEEIVSKLTMRLTPVIRPVPVAGDANRLHADGACPISENLRALNGKIEGISSQVASVLSRLEV
jgi:hypothetical protein